MLKRFYFLFLLFGVSFLTNGQHLKLVENRGEIGLFGGKASYVGDVAPGKLSFNNNYGAYYKKQYNDYAGLRLNYEKIQLTGNDTLSFSSYAKQRGMRFSRDFHDISLMGEFNFTRFLPGNKVYRFTPFLGFGIGYMFSITDGIRQAHYTTSTPAIIDSISLPTLMDTKKGILNVPIQIGFKYNLTQRWNLFAEGMYRFVFSDELDYFADGSLLVQTQKVASVLPMSTPIIQAYQGSRSGKDQFFSIKAGISYNLIKIYGEAKSKPGKKEFLAALGFKESGSKKRGFFNRLKFKRK